MVRCCRLRTKNALKELIVQGIQNEISNHEEIILAYIYGSFNRSLNFQDIDLAIVTKDFSSGYKSFQYTAYLGRLLENSLVERVEMDVRAINNAPAPFQFEVIRTGRLIFERDEAVRVAFETEVLSTYLDYQSSWMWQASKSR